MSTTNSSTPDPDEPVPAGEPVEPVTQTNALLASLLAGQGGLDLQSLLAARGVGGQSGNDLGLLGLLAARSSSGTTNSSSDDRMGLVLRWLEQQAAARAEAAGSGPSDAELEFLEAEELERQRRHLEGERERMRRLKQLLKALYAELETLRARNDQIAAALGACFLCFGEDPNCPECGGDGVPGSLPPDAAAFRHFVTPAMQAIPTYWTYQPIGVHAAPRKEANGYHGRTDNQPSSDSTA